MIGGEPDRVLRLPRGLSMRVAAVVSDPYNGYGSEEEFLLDVVRRALEAAELAQFRRREADR